MLGRALQGTPNPARTARGLAFHRPADAMQRTQDRAALVAG
jgi:hypothetical protein